MEGVVSQVRALAENADDVARKAIVTELRNLSIALESSDDTLQRLTNTPLQLYGAWIGSSLKIFDILSRGDGEVSLETLAHETEAEPVLLGRLLRYMSSVKLLDEKTAGHFSANNVTRTLATPRGQNYLDLYYNVVTPVFHELPKFLQRTEFRNPTDESKTAFQDAYKFQGPIYAWWEANPDKAALFNKHMEYRREDGGDWLDIFPIRKFTEPCEPDQAVFVDLGGGIGHQCARLRSSYPDLPGRVVLQDLPYAIENAIETPGVEKVTHDLFKPQPVRGARLYYLRGVLHCFTDEKCLKILENTREALGPNSCILIDEAVLPDSNVFWQATQQDVLMMASMASMERTRSQWETLLGKVGLKIAGVHVYSQSLYESVIVAISA